MAPYEPFNPSVTLHIHQTGPWTTGPLWNPQDHLMTASGPLNIPSVLLDRSEPFKTIRTPQGPS